MKHVDSIDQDFDLDLWTAVISGSLINGTQRAGFTNNETGEYIEVCTFEQLSDVGKFLKRYGLSRADVKRKW